MRMYPIDVEIRLSVCASSFEEAKETVMRGLKDGRYAGDAKLFYAHGDENSRKEVR